MNYYELLEIKPTASQDEIRIAYRKVAKKYHPDLNKGASPKKMIEVNKAYETLSDPDKRRTYDRQQGIGSQQHRNERADGYTYQWTHRGDFNGDFNGFGTDDFWDFFRQNMYTQKEKEYESTYTRQKLSVVRIKRILREEINNKKTYTAYGNTQCDFCSTPVITGDSFWFWYNKQKMCRKCRDDILSHI